MSPHSRSALADARRVRVAHVATVDLTVRFLLLPQLRRLRDEGYDVTAISAPGPWVDDLEREGIHFVPWTNATRAWDPRADARAFAELRDILRRERFDLVHTHNPKPGVLGRIAARVAGVPSVVNTVHGFWAMPEDPLTKRAMVLGAEAVASRFSDLELYQSAEDLRWGRRSLVVSRGRSRLLGNGTDVERFAPGAVPAARRAELRRKLGFDDGDVVVGAIGRLVAEKGYRELFVAARAIRATDPRVRFVVLGDADPSKPDSLAMDELGAASADVVFAGWRDDVRDVLGAVDVFVLASYREGLPRSAIEAAAMGVPLVLTDIRGCREVARDGIEGFLVPPRDASALEDALRDLVGDAELRATMGKAARARAEHRFDERRVGDRIVEGYREVLARRGIRAPGPDRRVRRAVPADAPRLASLHRRAMPTAFLPSLGDAFLEQLYRSLVSDPDAAVVVADAPEGLLGFCAATRSVRRSYRRFAVRRGVIAGLAAAPTLIGRVGRVRETAAYPASTEGLPDAELLAIAVEERGRRDGIGQELAARVVASMAARGVDEMKVVVDVENAPANRLYERVGFRPARRIEVHAGTMSNVWVIACRSSSPSSSASS